MSWLVLKKRDLIYTNNKAIIIDKEKNLLHSSSHISTEPENMDKRNKNSKKNRNQFNVISRKALKLHWASLSDNLFSTSWLHKTGESSFTQTS